VAAFRLALKESGHIEDQNVASWPEKTAIISVSPSDFALKSLRLGAPIMAGKIFINYRRDDSISTAGRLNDRLAQTFGRKKVFMDVDHTPAGVDFHDYLDKQVTACDVFLAVIGPNWLDAKDEEGRRRFDNPDDVVTVEIAAALARNIWVIPVLVDGARMPKADRLPDPVKPIVRRNAVEVRNTQFGRDAEALVEKIKEAVRGAEEEVAAAQSRWARFFLTQPAVSWRKRIFKGLFWLYFGIAILALPPLGLTALFVEPSVDFPSAWACVGYFVMSLGLALLFRLGAR